MEKPQLAREATVEQKHHCQIKQMLELPGRHCKTAVIIKMLHQVNVKTLDQMENKEASAKI